MGEFEPVAGLFVDDFGEVQDRDSYRERAWKALLGTEQLFPLAQDYFHASDAMLLDQLEAKIAKSVAVIALVGPSSGETPPSHPHRTYTQLEFDWARDYGKPVFLFEPADECELPSPAKDPNGLQAQFIEELKQNSGARPIDISRRSCFRPLIYSVETDLRYIAF